MIPLEILHHPEDMIVINEEINTGKSSVKNGWNRYADMTVHTKKYELFDSKNEIIVKIHVQETTPIKTLSFFQAEIYTDFPNEKTEYHIHNIQEFYKNQLYEEHVSFTFQHKKPSRLTRFRWEVRLQNYKNKVRKHIQEKRYNVFPIRKLMEKKMEENTLFYKKVVRSDVLPVLMSLFTKQNIHIYMENIKIKTYPVREHAYIEEVILYDFLCLTFLIKQDALWECRLVSLYEMESLSV